MDARQFLLRLGLARRLVGRDAIAQALGVSRQTAKQWEIGAFAPALDRDLDAMARKLDTLIEAGGRDLERAVDGALAKLAGQAEGP